MRYADDEGRPFAHGTVDINGSVVGKHDALYNGQPEPCPRADPPSGVRVEALENPGKDVQGDAAAGISDGLLRIAVGLEAVEDLQMDLERGLQLV